MPETSVENAWRGAHIITLQMNPVNWKVLAGPSGSGIETVMAPKTLQPRCARTCGAISWRAWPHLGQPPELRGLPLDAAHRLGRISVSG